MKNDIFSLDKNRIFITKTKDKTIFNKKSSEKEYFELKKAYSILNSKSIIIDDINYTIKIPKIYNYSNEILSMEYLEGLNLEILLKNLNSRENAVNILNHCLTFFINNKINWIDFAPRNILIKDNTLIMVDFEKGINISKFNTIDFLRHHVYEEYSSFLFENERIYSVNDIFSLQSYEIDYLMSIEDISIKRCKFVAKKIYHKDKILFSEFLNSWKTIINAEIPFISKNNELVFPRIELSQILNDNGKKNYTLYATKILQFSNNKYTVSKDTD